MTKFSSASSSAPPRNLPISSASITLRRLSSIALAVLLYTAAIPFTPCYWILNLDGALLLDRFVAGILLFSALYFQWQIASQKTPVAIIIPLGDGQTINAGRVGARINGDEFAWLYRPSEYWLFAAGEVGLLGLAQWGGNEILRRGLVCGVIGALWSVGWFVTPESMKKWAWEYAKSIWYWVVVTEVLNFGSGTSSRRARRRY